MNQVDNFVSIKLKTQLNPNHKLYDTAESLCKGFNFIIEKNGYKKRSDIDLALDSFLAKLPNDLVVNCKFFYEVEKDKKINKQIEM